MKANASAISTDPPFRIRFPSAMKAPSRNRIIAGTLVEVGLGRIRPDQIQEILLSKDRAKAGYTAPPQGLYLVQVYYEREEQ